MKSVILALTLTLSTNVYSFEQIFAINGGGGAHKDSDGIVYQERVSSNANKNQFDKLLPNVSVPTLDHDIYRTYDYSRDPVAPIKYDIPLTNSGFYLMIVKFAYNGSGANITLNNEVKILSKDHFIDPCGGFQICEAYIYFCVSNKTLYFDDQSTDIRNGTVHIEFTPSGAAETRVAGLVLLKGQLGNGQELISSPTRAPFLFEPKIINPMCVLTDIPNMPAVVKPKTNQLPTNLTFEVLDGSIEKNEIPDIPEVVQPKTNPLQPNLTFEVVEASNENTQSLVNILQKRQIDDIDQLQKSIDRLSDNSLKNISNLYAGIREANLNITSAVKDIQQQQSDNTNQLETKIDHLGETSLESLTNLKALAHTTLQELQRAGMNTQVAYQNLQRHQHDNFNQLLHYLDRFNLTENNLEYVSNLQAVIKASTEGVQTVNENLQHTILREVQNLQRQEKRAEKQINKRLDTTSRLITGNFNSQFYRLRSELQSSSNERINIKVEKLQSELSSQVTKNDRANYNIGLLDGVQRRSDTTIRKIRSEQANLTLKICEMNRHLGEIYSLLRVIAKIENDP